MLPLRSFSVILLPEIVDMRLLILFILVIPTLRSVAQPEWWRGELRREDGKVIVFNFEWKNRHDKATWFIHNASEKIKVDDIEKKGDSLIIHMPLFESQFRLVYSKQEIKGVWIKGGAVKTTILPFFASPGHARFPVSKIKGTNISGRWAVRFDPANEARAAVAEFRQDGNHVTGTFLNASGDFRFLEGAVIADSLYLSTFDGSHAYLFTAKIESDQRITGGTHFAGATAKEAWEANKDGSATIPLEETAIYLKPGEERLDFTFKDLEGHPVSINDEQFRNKVTIVQLMGSWCPNCMDETAFLTEYYKKNKHRGVAVVALAYEYSTDWERSVRSLKKFQKRFDVKYPILITGVAVNDSLKTEKTLPQITPIKSFPSSIIIDKKGKIRKLDNSFNGPGTGQHYVEYKNEFEEMMDALLSEK